MIYSSESSLGRVQSIAEQRIIGADQRIFEKMRTDERRRDESCLCEKSMNHAKPSEDR